MTSEFARGDALANARRLFQHRHGQAALSHGVGAGQADGARADHHRIEIERRRLLGHPSLMTKLARRIKRQALARSIARREVVADQCFKVSRRR